MNTVQFIMFALIGFGLIVAVSLPFIRQVLSDRRKQRVIDGMIDRWHSESKNTSKETER
jgi:hypothetical protein